MFSTPYGSFNGPLWEGMFQVILKRKHMDVHYQRVVASPGDFGLEGFTRDGKAFQCYCPDFNEDSKKLRERQQNKIREDINKLQANHGDLEKILGGVKLSSWTLITPRIAHHDLLMYCNKKRDLVKSWNLSIIDNTAFEVLMHECDDYAQEIGEYFDQSNRKFSITPDLQETEANRVIQWKDTEITLVNNALLKNKIRVKARANPIDVDKKTNDLTDAVIKYYLNGESILRIWQGAQPENHQRFVELVASLEEELRERCILSEVNPNDFVDQIRSIVDEKLAAAFPRLDEATIGRLKNYCISTWLLSCPLYFEVSNDEK